ncbi:acyl CoA:acetate/3-ketoacid CoA transferase [Pseudomonas sp. CES]|uniref:acyl CoA:acetate/3-ketoacid CoA transferase n=1 Tax=Pseudomonas sp. CES TaxID=2719586 RepID=UPI00146FCC65|nr:CoA-transferase [Pseudomonas sp. CES]KAF4558106.1 CoA-transferase [Pseudomonas sp. CES]
MKKVVTAVQAAALINDGDTVAWTSVGMSFFAEEVAIALEKRFLNTGAPSGLHVVHDCGCGDGKSGGMSHLAHPRLIKRLVSGHTGFAQEMGKLIVNNQIEGYLLPQGVLATLWREIASHRPGVITKVGIGTYVDPRVSGGRVTSCATEDMVKVIEIEGEEWLLYKAFPLDVAIIRATTADINGNLTMEEEAMLAEALPMAQAAKNSGGIVIAQVKYLAEANSLHPKNVKVPGVLVDYIVVADPENHRQTIGSIYSPCLAGHLRIPLASIPVMPLNERKIIARRAAMELRDDMIVNLGIGVPADIAAVAVEEGVVDRFTLTTEIGSYGGMPASGGDFGSAYNAEAIIEHESQFDFYDGGGLDIAFLGLAQADAQGNLNVSKFGDRVIGAGGFINISQRSKKVVFCGTFMNGASLEIRNGKLSVVDEGKTRKFIRNVEQITFSGTVAQRDKKEVMYVTERCVFELDEDGGMTLVEIAPGIDMEKDIISLMEFRPRVSPDLREMPRSLFSDSWGELGEVMSSSQ